SLRQSARKIRRRFSVVARSVLCSISVWPRSFLRNVSHATPVARLSVSVDFCAAECADRICRNGNALLRQKFCDDLKRGFLLAKRCDALLQWQKLLMLRPPPRLIIRCGNLQRSVD